MGMEDFLLKSEFFFSNNQADINYESLKYFIESDLKLIAWGRVVTKRQTAWPVARKTSERRSGLNLSRKY